MEVKVHDLDCVFVTKIRLCFSGTWSRIPAIHLGTSPGTVSRKPPVHIRLQLMEEHCCFSCSLWVLPFKAHVVFFIVCFLWTFRPRFSGIWCGNVCVGTLEFFSLKVSPTFAIVLLITSDSHQTLFSPLRTQERTKHAQVTARCSCTIFALFGSIRTKSLN
jgi:hypothetical protein